MKGPDKIKIGPHTFTVTYSPAVELCGNTQVEHLAIGINTAQAPSQIRDTLLHELVHALLAPTKLDDDVEEQVCMALGPGLLALFVDNPDLHPYLVKESA